MTEPASTEAPSFVAEMVQHLTPTLNGVVRDEIVPALRDPAVQDRIGAAVGRAIAAEYRTQINIATAAAVAAAIALAAIAASLIYDLVTQGD